MISALFASIPWWLAGLISNVCIIYTEYTNRAHPGGWMEALPYTFFPILIAQFCLWNSFSGAPHWLTAWAAFSIGNSIMRVGGVYLMSSHEVTSWAHAILGICVMTGGAFLIKEGLR